MEKLILGNGKTFDCDYFYEYYDELRMRFTQDIDLNEFLMAIATNDGTFQYEGTKYENYTKLRLLKREYSTYYFSLERADTEN